MRQIFHFYRIKSNGKHNCGVGKGYPLFFRVSFPPGTRKNRFELRPRSAKCSFPLVFQNLSFFFQKMFAMVGDPILGGRSMGISNERVRK